jgi:hypothetical protein
MTTHADEFTTLEKEWMLWWLISPQCVRKDQTEPEPITETIDGLASDLILPFDLLYSRKVARLTNKNNPLAFDTSLHMKPQVLSSGPATPDTIGQQLS